jgi:hypothetical protein
MVEALDAQAAATINAHRSTEMVEKIYDVRNAKRKMEELKGVKNRFA